MTLTETAKNIGKMYALLKPKATKKELSQASQNPVAEFSKLYAASNLGRNLSEEDRGELEDLIAATDIANFPESPEAALCSAFLSAVTEKPMSKLRELRMRRNMSQEEMAKALGVPQQNVSRWETGKLPRYEKCREIAKLLGVTMEELADPEENS